jgi:transcriptional regulator with XRE-family HTH domain
MSRSFGARLRTARERKGIGLDAIAQNTKINAALFDALERGDTSRWPSGIFRRAFLRAYANAIGLDPEATLKEFLEVFPDPFDAPASALERGEGTAAAAELSGEAGPLRLTFADDPRHSISAAVDTLVGGWLRPCAAVCDLAIVIAIAAAVFAAAGRFWTPFTIVTVCYYFGGVLMIGNSPGAWLLAGRRFRRSPQEGITPTPLPAVAATSDDAESVERFTTRRYPKAV